MTVSRPIYAPASLTPGVGGALQLAAVRAALVPVVLLGEQLVDHPADQRQAFWILLVAFALWATADLGLHVVARSGRVLVPPWLERAEPFVDLAAIVALTYTSGGPFSETGMAFFVLPLLAAARLRPDVTARWSAAAVAAYITLSLLHPTAGESEATARMISQVAYLTWAGVAATLLSAVLARRDAAIARLALRAGPARRARADGRAARAAPARGAAARRVRTDAGARPAGARRLPPHRPRRRVRARTRGDHRDADAAARPDLRAAPVRPRSRRPAGRAACDRRPLHGPARAPRSTLRWTPRRAACTTSC